MIPSAWLVYPRTGRITGYSYHQPDPPISVHRLGDIVPSKQAIENYQLLTQDSVFA